MMQHQRLYLILAMAGTLPFVAAAILPLVGVDRLGPFDDAASVAASYGLAIVCFLAGAHWATFLYRKSELPINLFVWSNIIVLGVWFPFLIASIVVVIAAQIVAFLALLAIDYRLLAIDVIEAHYFRTRTTATAIATVSLLTILIAQ